MQDFRTKATAWAERLGMGGWVAQFRASPLAQRLARGTFWTLVSVVVSRLATLVGMMMAARLLGREVFGQFGIVQSTVNMFGVLASFGMSVTATKYVAEYRVRDPARAGRILHACTMMAWMTGVIMTALLVILAPWLASATLAAPQLSFPLRVAAPALLLGALGAAQYGGLTGLEAFRFLAMATARANFLILLTLVVGSWWLGLRGAVASLVVGAGCLWLFQRLALFRAAAEAGVPIKGERRIDWRVLWVFSLPAVLGGVMTGPVNWICNAMLVNGAGGYSEMGAYNAGNQYLNALLFIPVVLSQTVLPMLSERFGAMDQSRSMKLMLLSVRVNGLAVWPAALIGSLISPWLMRLYGPSFADAWLTLVVCLLTAGVIAILVPVGQVLAASGRMWTGFTMNAGWALAFMGFAYLLVDRGSFGLALARLFAYLLHAIWTLWYAIRLLRTMQPAPDAPAPAAR